jgi:hypothetical protein
LEIEGPPAVLVLAQFAAIAIGVLDAVEVLATFEAWETSGFTRFYTPKEGSKGLVQAAQEVLQAGSVDLPEGIGLIPAHISEMCPLRAIANPFARFSIGCYALLERGIVDQPGLP